MTKRAGCCPASSPGTEQPSHSRERCHRLCTLQPHAARAHYKRRRTGKTCPGGIVEFDADMRHVVGEGYVDDNLTRNTGLCSRGSGVLWRCAQDDETEYVIAFNGPFDDAGAGLVHHRMRSNAADLQD